MDPVEDPAGPLVRAVRDQAVACGRLGSPLYAGLLARVADDLAAGGPSAHVLRDHLEAPGPAAVALRLAGSVHRLVLERRAGVLATYYPSVGGTWDDEAGWAAFRTLLAEQPGEVEEWLDRPPQTNEVGRATGLMGGLLTLTRRRDLPVRLHEIGSSAGLTLLADRFRYVATGGRAGDGTVHVVGPADSPVVLEPAWTGPVPWDAPWPRIVERAGSDVRPIDARTTAGRLALTAYVWPDQVARHERLRGALDLARQEHPAPVVRARTAGEAVAGLELRPGAWTVLWHSVMWQYLPAAEQALVRSRIDELGRQASAAAPFAHLSLEPTRPAPGREHEFLVVLEAWAGQPGAGERVVLGRSRGHGVPTDWEQNLPS